MGAAPRQAIEAPQTLTAPAVGSLVRSALDASADGRWNSGYRYLPNPCGGAGVYAPCDTVTAGDLDADAQPEWVEAEPFYVWAADRCSSFGFEAHAFEARAQAVLEACESAQIAGELWTGDLAQAQGWPNRRLADPASNDLGTGLSPLDALACLEQGLAECRCGSRGMIHATPQLVTHWFTNGSVVRTGDLITTVRGTIVVTDGGYDGSAPDGGPAVDGSVWAYATDMVVVRRDTIDIVPGGITGEAAARELARAQALDRTLNTFEYRAQRLASATWDGCCHLAASVDIDLCDTAGS